MEERRKVDDMIDCILCGCCYASCTVTLSDPEYLGPHALLWADRFVSDSRDDAGAERLNLVDSEHGVWRCHTIFNCAEVCPKNLNPTHSIAKLKRRAITNRLFGRFAK